MSKKNAPKTEKSKLKDKPAEELVAEQTTELVKVESKQEVDPARKDQLEKLKKRIHSLTDNFIQVVIDLKTIQKEELWKLEVDENGKPIYNTFESFIDVEFGFKRAYYSRLNKAAETYNWLAEHDSEIQKNIKVVRPAFYETLGRLPEDDRIDTLQKLLKDKKQKQKASSLVSIWNKTHKGQSLTQNPKAKDINKQLQVVLGILDKIVLEELDGMELPISSEMDMEKLKSVIKRLSDKISAKSKS